MDSTIANENDLQELLEKMINNVYKELGPGFSECVYQIKIKQKKNLFFVNYIFFNELNIKKYKI